MKSIETQIRSMARKNGISLRGNKDDVSYWSGYSYDQYRYVAASVDGDEVTDVWEGWESGNFLPTNCLYAVVINGMKAKDTIDQMCGEY